MLEDEFTLYIYTDGSFHYVQGNCGGVGIVFVYTDEKGKERTHEVSPIGYRGGTNNEMEIKACALALIEARTNPLFARCRNIIIRTDSLFVMTYAPYAEKYWAYNGWKKKNNLPVENKADWKEYLKAKKKLGKQVEFQKVKAHSSNRYNNRADKLANNSAKLPLKKSLNQVIARRKLLKGQLVIGCVPMKGQEIKIRVYRTKKIDSKDGYEKYWYEVLDINSEYYSKCDSIYSKFSLRAGHCYKVKVNKNGSAPEIIEILDEVGLV